MSFWLVLPLVIWAIPLVILACLAIDEYVIRQWRDDPIAESYRVIRDDRRVAELEDAWAREAYTP